MRTIWQLRLCQLRISSVWRMSPGPIVPSASKTSILLEFHVIFQCAATCCTELASINYSKLATTLVPSVRLLSWIWVNYGRTWTTKSRTLQCPHSITPTWCRFSARTVTRKARWSSTLLAASVFTAGRTTPVASKDLSSRQVGSSAVLVVVVRLVAGRSKPSSSNQAASPDDDQSSSNSQES